MPAWRQPVLRTLRTKLKEARLARLATIDAGDRPHIVPVCFFFDGKVFYSAVDRKPKRVAAEKLARLQHIKRKSQIALLIDHYQEDWSQLWFILIRGQAELVAPSARRERIRVLRGLRKKYPQYAAGLLADDAPIIRIVPRHISSWGLPLHG